MCDRGVIILFGVSEEKLSLYFLYLEFHIFDFILNEDCEAETPGCTPKPWAPGNCPYKQVGGLRGMVALQCVLVQIHMWTDSPY